MGCPGDLFLGEPSRIAAVVFGAADVPHHAQARGLIRGDLERVRLARGEAHGRDVARDLARYAVAHLVVVDTHHAEHVAGFDFGEVGLVAKFFRMGAHLGGQDGQAREARCGSGGGGEHGGVERASACLRKVVRGCLC